MVPATLRMLGFAGSRCGAVRTSVRRHEFKIHHRWRLSRRFVVTAAAAAIARWRGQVRFGVGSRESPVRQLALGALIGASAMTATVGVILLARAARIDRFHVDVPLLG
jgi:hypothetical protein